MTKIEIEGYLTQAKLEKALFEIVGNENWGGREVPVSKNNRQRWDMVIHLGDQKIAVEFDGDRHYTNIIQIYSDIKKEKIAHEEKMLVVRIPYWVQLTSQTFEHYFGLKVNIVQNFPHGFISKNVTVPGSFCEFGIIRFVDEIASLPQSVIFDVMRSLVKKQEEYKIDDVDFFIPKRLQFFLNDAVINAGKRLM